MVTKKWVNIGPGNGLLPSGKKPLHVPMLTYHQVSWCGSYLRAISSQVPHLLLYIMTLIIVFFKEFEAMVACEAHMWLLLVPVATCLPCCWLQTVANQWLRWLCTNHHKTHMGYSNNPGVTIPSVAAAPDSTTQQFAHARIWQLALNTPLQLVHGHPWKLVSRSVLSPAISPAPSLHPVYTHPQGLR